MKRFRIAGEQVMKSIGALPSGNSGSTWKSDVSRGSGAHISVAPEPNTMVIEVLDVARISAITRDDERETLAFSKAWLVRSVVRAPRADPVAGQNP